MITKSHLISARVSRYWRGTVTGLLLGLTSGCASFIATTPQVTARIPTRTALGPLPAAIGPQWVRSGWWRQFDDVQLDALVAKALAGNPGLAEVRARVRIAQAQLQAADASELPSLNLGGAVVRERLSGNGLVPPPIAGTTQSPSALGLQADQELDLWGRNAALVNGALSASKAVQAQAALVQSTITTALVVDYIALDAVSRRQARLQEALGLQQDMFALIRHRQQAGLLSADGVDISQAGLDATRAALAVSRARISALRYAIVMLAGENPDAAADLTTPRLATVTELTLPSTIPSELVLRRPDVAVALWRVNAAMAGVENAKADFLPRFNLIATAGLNALTFGKLFQGASKTGGIGVGLSLPIFEGGRLRAQLHAREAGYDAATAEYNRTLLNALRDIATTIATWQQQQLAATELDQAQQAILHAAQSAANRYQAGIASRSDVIVARLRLLRANGAHDDLRDRELTTLAELAHALGGGVEFDAAQLPSHS